MNNYKRHMKYGSRSEPWSHFHRGFSLFGFITCSFNVLIQPHQQNFQMFLLLLETRTEIRVNTFKSELKQNAIVGLCLLDV